MEAAVVYDSNFNRRGSVKARLGMVLGAGMSASVIYVHRDPVFAYLEGVIPRALVEGRCVPIEGHLRMHRDALKTFLRVQRAYANEVRAEFVVLLNTGVKGAPSLADITYLSRLNYHQDELFSAIQEGVDHAYRTGEISEDLYRACCGRVPGQLR
jgi:hypothetical protein